MRETCFFDTNDLAQGLARSLAPGLEARVFAGVNVMVSVVRIEPRAHGAVHAHTEEQWGYLIAGDGVRTLDGVDHPVAAGHLWYTPGGAPHAFKAGDRGAVILDVFSPPREEYRRPGSGFGS